MLVVGCVPPPPPLDFVPPPGEDYITEFEFLSPKQTADLADGFDWEDTEELPELDNSQQIPRPALYYAWVYIQTPDHVLELDEMGTHVSNVPLLEDEWQEFPFDEAVKLTFEGDGEGMFVYTIMPGVTYNALRQEALAGAPLYRAVIIQGIPPDATTAVGSMSYEYLVERGFEYQQAIVRDDFVPEGGLEEDPDDPDMPLVAEAPEPRFKRLARRLRRAIRRIVDRIRDRVDDVREAFGDIARTIRPTADMLSTFAALNSDIDYGSSAMIQAWGADAGSIITFNETRAIVRQFGGLTIERRTTDDVGQANFGVVVGRSVALCLEAFGASARLERSIVFPIQTCRRFDPPAGVAAFSRDSFVRDAEFHVYAQAVDGYEFSRTVLGFVPRRAVIQTGRLANAYASVIGASQTPCASRSSTTALEVLMLAFDFIGSSPIVEFFSAVDIVFDPGADETSRILPTHEYGHFVLCDLLLQTNETAFDLVWTESTFGGVMADNETVGLNEGWADWFSAQVAGGVVKFETSPTPVALFPTGYQDSEARWAFDSQAPSLGGALEENIGAPQCGGARPFPACQVTPRPGAPTCTFPPGGGGCIGGDEIDQQSARASSLFHDLVDGWPARTDAPGQGAFWTQDVTLQLVPGAFGADFRDEEIRLSGPQLMSAIRRWATTRPPTPLPADRFRYESLMRAVSTSARNAGFTDAQLVGAYTLHTATRGEAFDWL